MTGTISLDSRPSDSIALAVRAECPIFISEEIIDDAGVSIQFITEKDDVSTSDIEEKRIELERALEDAVTKEHYEEAAKIRDQIKKINEDLF
jgi:hypothetical protein